MLANPDVRRLAAVVAEVVLVVLGLAALGEDGGGEHDESEHEHRVAVVALHF